MSTYKLTISEKGKKATKSIELADSDLKLIADQLEEDVDSCVLAKELYTYLVDLGVVEKRTYRVYFNQTEDVEAVSSEQAEEFVQNKYPGADIDDVDLL